MKFTIEGFSQEYAATLRKTVADGKDGKEKLIKIDCTDLVILRWFVDFFPNMKKMSIDGEEYAWLSHKKLCEDLPLLDISKRGCIDRMQKLVQFDILKYKLIKEGGTFSLYGFGKNYINLIRSTDIGGIRSTDIGGIRSTDIGGYVQTDNKDTSFRDTTTIDNSISDKEERKKESKQSTYDDILSEIQPDDLRDLFSEYIKMRKMIKSPMTDRALRMLISKVNELEPNNVENQKKLLETAIINNWKSVYPLKDEKPVRANNNTSGNIFLDIAREENIQ